MPDSHVMTLADGRSLGWTEFGVTEGWPVFGFHGTPGSRRQVCIYEDHARASGVRLIAPDRPGYGLSTYQPRRRLAEWPSDVQQLADHLDIDKFSVLGISGGGPHAAACAAILGSRVAAVAIVSGAVPLSSPRIAGELSGADRVVAYLAQRCPVLLHQFLSTEVSVARRFPQRSFRLFIRQFPPPDAEILTRPELKALFELDMAEASRTTARAMLQDLQLFASDWGFDLASIEVPLTFWQGDQDKAVRPGLTQLVHQELPNSDLRLFEGEGHLLVIDRLEEILRTIVPE